MSQMTGSASSGNPKALCVAVTGGGRGIGAAIAEAFARRGDAVAIGDVDGAVAASTAARLGARVHAYPLDVTDRASFARFLDDAEDDLGPVDVVVNNAGIMSVVAFDEESPASIARQMNVNVMGVIHGTQLAIGRMVGSGRAGHIVNVASAAGKIGFPGVATYCATKHAVVGLTEALALEYATRAITFSCVMPGAVSTELAAGLAEHRLLPTVQPEDVAAAIVSAVDGVGGDVYVPARLAPLVRVRGLLSRRLTRATMTRLGVNSYMSDAAGSSARRGYERRLTQTDQPWSST